MKKSKTAKKTVRLIFVALLILLIVWTLWANKAVQLNDITISSKKLPKSFDGYKIALVSDLHNTEFGEGNEKLLKLLEQASPDIIAITGDIIDSNRLDIKISVEFAKKAVEIAPCYYVSGNHEALINGTDYDMLKSELERCGLIVLENEETTIEKNGEKISLIGIDSVNSSSLNITAEKINAISTTDNFKLMLSHFPESFDVYCEAGIDLTLCGHAHGGQFRLPFIGGLYVPSQGFFPKYDSGLYSRGNSSMIVSRGLGNSVFPLRFNNRPEVVLVELRADS